MLLLVLVNAWKWWPSMNAGVNGRDASGGREFSVADFQVHGLTSDQQSKSVRDLFRKGNSAPGTDEQKAAASRAARKAVAVVQPVVPTLTPEELAVMASRTELGQIKCIGVLFQQNKKPEAYMVRGDQRYVVRPGDLVGAQFVVEKISIDAVFLKDRQTGVTGTVPVDGKEGRVTQ